MRDFVLMLEKQTMIIFKNIEVTISVIDDDYWYKRVGGYVVWKQLYHLLNSIDRIYAIPENYEYPNFHVEGLNTLDKESAIELNKDTMIHYFLRIKEKVILYLQGLDDQRLLEEVIFQGMKLTRFDFILAQMRHITWHLGYIHNCIKQETGNLPDYIGVNCDYYPM